MTDDGKLSPMDPVHVAMIGTGDGGIENGVTAHTPAYSPNVIIRVVTPLVAVVIRFVNLYLVTLVGLIGAAMTPLGNEVLPSHDFVALVKTCADLSLGAAGFGFLKDLVTVFGKLEGKFPLLTGSV